MTELDELSCAPNSMSVFCASKISSYVDDLAKVKDCPR